jgi:hypothetical protein
VLCSCTISEVLFGLLNSICLSSPDCCRGSLVSRFAFPLPPALAPRVLSFPVLSLCSQIVLPLQDRVVFLLVASCQIRLTVFGLAECADQIPLSKSSPALVRAVSELGRRFGHQGAHRTNRFFSVVLALSLAPSLPCRLLFAGSVSS